MDPSDAAVGGVAEPGGADGGGSDMEDDSWADAVVARSAPSLAAPAAAGAPDEASRGVQGTALPCRESPGAGLGGEAGSAVQPPCTLGASVADAAPEAEHERNALIAAWLALPGSRGADADWVGFAEWPIGRLRAFVVTAETLAGTGAEGGRQREGRR